MAFACPSCHKPAPVIDTRRVNVATDRWHHCALCELGFGTREVLGVTTLRPVTEAQPSKRQAFAASLIVPDE